MNKVQYRDYLRSDHWQQLKLKKSKVAKKCRCCGIKPVSSEYHHVRYRQIHDVTTRDIRRLCSECHSTYEALKTEYPDWRDSELWSETLRIVNAGRKSTHASSPVIVKRFITPELLKSIQTHQGGWSKEALAKLGVSWPPRKGWKKKLEGEARHNLRTGYWKADAVFQ